MSALEQEVLDKYRLLDKEAQQRVRQQMAQETDTEPRTVSEWLEAATKLGDELTAKYGKLDLSISDLIHEAREERLDAILESIYGNQEWLPFQMTIRSNP